MKGKQLFRAGPGRVTLRSVKTVPVHERQRRCVWPVSSARAERLEISVPLVVLALEARIPAAHLSLHERGLRTLAPQQEQARREALARLRTRYEEGSG